MALARVGDVLAADYRVDGRMVSRALFDVALNTVVSEADTSGRTSYLASVSATATVRDPAGVAVPSPLQPTGVTGP